MIYKFHALHIKLIKSLGYLLSVFGKEYKYIFLYNQADRIFIYVTLKYAV